MNVKFSFHANLGRAHWSRPRNVRPQVDVWIFSLLAALPACIASTIIIGTFAAKPGSSTHLVRQTATRSECRFSGFRTERSARLNASIGLRIDIARRKSIGANEAIRLTVARKLSNG
jgi:hypothetical protein